MGNEDDNPTKTCWIQIYALCLLVSLNAEVLVVVSCVQDSWSQVSTFSCYSHCLPLIQNASKGMKTIFKNLCVDTNRICLPKLCHLPQYSYGSHHPGTWLRLVPGFKDPGSVLILGQVTQYGNPYLICITKKSPKLCITGGPLCMGSVYRFLAKGPEM